jgi:hypothetical protein
MRRFGVILGPSILMSNSVGAENALVPCAYKREERLQ